MDDFVELREVLSKLPFGKGKMTGIYGIGAHTKRLLQAYEREIGSIEAKLIFIDTNMQSLQEMYLGCPVYNVQDIRDLPLDAIILSSLLYEDEMNQTLLRLYGCRFAIYRFYEWGQDEIFDVGGMYSKPETDKRRRLKVNFADFGQGFDPVHNLFMAVLFPEYRLEIYDIPDILFCSHFGDEHKQYQNCIKIFLETEVMPFSLQDYDLCSWI